MKSCRTTILCTVFKKTFSWIMTEFCMIKSDLLSLYVYAIKSLSVKSTPLPPTERTVSVKYFFTNSNTVHMELILNRPISQIPECTCSISNNAPFRTEMCLLALSPNVTLLNFSNRTNRTCVILSLQVNKNKITNAQRTRILDTSSNKQLWNSTIKGQGQC